MEHHKEAATNTVQLDNGKKWKANPETITGIRNMRRLTDAGIAGTLQQQPLVDSLQQELKTIFDKCTMKGEAHEQLHQYLVPLKNRLDILKTGAKREETLLDIRAYLETFDNYFEA